MHERLFLARLFLVTGGILAVAGMILWRALPISAAMPPYLFTAGLALGYGAVCRWGRVKKPDAPGKP